MTAMTSCVTTIEPEITVENEPDTVAIKRHKSLPSTPKDTTESENVPMGWNPIVEDWEEVNI